MRKLVEQGRSARIATVERDGRAHVVPFVYVLDGNTVYSTSDAGPPTRRMRNLRNDARVTLLVDHYDEDWTRVWWVRLRGTGRLVQDAAERSRARRLLVEKYPQFTQAPPEEGAGPVMAVDVQEWAGWSYTP